MNNSYLIDSSSYNRVINVTNSVAQTSVGPIDPPVNIAYDPTLHGASLYLSAGNARVSANGSAELAPGTGDFTVEMWLNFQVASLGVFLRVAPYAAYRNADGSFVWGHDSFGIYSSPANQIPLGTWKHFAMSRVSGTMRYFINGALVNTQADTSNYNWTASEFALGTTDGTNSMTGFISGFRLVVGTGLYTSTFTPATIPTNVTNTRMLLLFQNIGIADMATKNQLVLIGNARRSSSSFKYGSFALELPGTSYVQVANNTLNTHLMMGTGDFTHEGWIQYTGGSGPRVVYRLGLLGTAYFQVYLNGSNQLAVDVNGLTILTRSTALTINQWYHFASVRASGTYYFFVDGVLVGTSTTNGGLNGTVGKLNIGCGVDASEYWVGFIDDFRLTKGVARYTSGFTPPLELPKY